VACLPFPDDYYTKLIPPARTGRRIDFRELATPTFRHQPSNSPRTNRDGFGPLGDRLKVPRDRTAADFKASTLFRQPR